MTTPTPSGSGGSPRQESPLVQALQALLGAEHAAVYGYGVVGARSTGPAQVRARAALDAHRARRDEVERLIAQSGGRPEAAAPAYSLPFPVVSAADAARLAAHLEDGVAAHQANLVAEASGEQRVATAKWLQQTAFEASTWRGSTVAFPGLPERAPGAASGTPAAGGAASGATNSAGPAAGSGRPS